MKKRLFQIHSWLGLLGALAVVIIGLTGSSLVFYRELDRLMNPSMLVVVPQANTLPLQQLVLRAREAWPEYQLSSVSFDPYNSPDAALTFWLERGEAYAQGHMDPYTGEALGVRDDTLLLWLLRLHSRFLGEDFGETAVFLVGVLLLLSCLTGIFMVRDFARLLTRPRLWGASVRLLLSDWHKLLGVTALVFNLMIGFTGVLMNWGAVLRVVKGEPNKKDPPAKYIASPRSEDDLVAIAQKALPGLTVTWFSFPVEGDNAVSVNGSVPGAWLYGPYGCFIVMDGASGEVTKVIDIRRAGWAEKFDALIAPLHFGNFGGFWVKLIYCLAGLTPALLAVTGCLIWWRRRKRSDPDRNAIRHPAA